MSTHTKATRLSEDMKYMSKKNLFFVVVAATFESMLGGCGGVTDLRNNISPPIGNTIIQGIQASEEKGCLSCHNGIETINDRMQPFLLSFAKQKYKRGKGYECAICHEGNPSSGKKEEAHDSLIPNPSSMWV